MAIKVVINDTKRRLTDPATLNRGTIDVNIVLYKFTFVWSASDEIEMQIACYGWRKNGTTIFE